MADKPKDPPGTMTQTDKCAEEAARLLPADCKVAPVTMRDRTIHGYRVRCDGTEVRILVEQHEDCMAAGAETLAPFIRQMVLEAKAGEHPPQRHTQHGADHQMQEDVRHLEQLQQDAHNAEWSRADPDTQAEFRAAWSRYHNQLQAMYERGLLTPARKEGSAP